MKEKIVKEEILKDKIRKIQKCYALKLGDGAWHICWEMFSTNVLKVSYLMGNLLLSSADLKWCSNCE